ncbi:MAG: DUF1722 domain-containing protein [Desulfobacter sp.]|nr:MAG: DUF1722 domain-containing protein [Desulfobacter sp.]
MRIWDIDPGFLNDQSLLGEHRELHGLMSIHINNKKGYSRHPETLRWQHSLTGLYQRHELLVSEMTLRGMNHNSPLDRPRGSLSWPEEWIDPPHTQFDLLRAKYTNKPGGRIPLPQNPMALWASHKYSVMARDPGLYRQLGPEVAQKKLTLASLSLSLAQTLRQPPEQGRLDNALDHMWGYVSGISALDRKDLDARRLFNEIQSLSISGEITYLTRSTALGELGAWF